MSSGDRFVRHHKIYTDRAIGEAYSRLASESLARATLTELLHGVRERSASILRAPLADGRHSGVEALFNLARFAGSHARPVTSWAGSDASWRGAVSSLAQHLLGRYTIPPFLGAAWYAAGDRFSEAKRRWFIAHAAGQRFRSLDLPICMTRRMEHIFLESHDHLEIDHAMRRAELLGLGAPPDLVDAVLATRRSRDLSNGRFWRTVWLFLIAHSNAMDVVHVAPIIDFLQSVRHERVAVDTPRGTVMREPPQPRFSLQGRTPRSLLRMMDEWHRGLGRMSGGLWWAPSRLRPMVVEVPRLDSSAPPLSWELSELTSSAQLRAEGAALQHCVASYGQRCWRGASRIWSLRLRRDAHVRSVVTVEVDVERNAIVQARGFRNRPASGQALQLVHAWAVRENLRMAL